MYEKYDVSVMLADSLKGCIILDWKLFFSEGRTITLLSFYI